MALCATCAGGAAQIVPLLGKRPPHESETRARHHARLTDLQVAVDKGCPICTFLWDEHHADLTQNAHGERLAHVGEQGLLECTVERLYDVCSFHLRYTNRIGPLASFQALPSEIFDSADFGCPKASSTSSEETFSTISGWLNECTHDDKYCNEGHDCDWHPTRLLDVRPALSSQDVIRLVLPEQDDVEGPYVTLSHCWGGVDFLKLSHDKLSEMRVGIRIETLPLTFRETVQAVRRLGLRYLWIDSLCIIQGDKQDWLRESVQMEDVYANAFCNIGATSSADSDGGLFRHRNPTKLRRIEHELTSSAEDGSYARRYTFLHDEYWWNLNEAPLHKRAWVVQERLLARRVIHFTDTEVVFECRQHQASEAYPRGLPEQIVFDGVFGKQIFRPSYDSDHVWQETWSHFVGFYSRCQLTRFSDRLIAIAGIVKNIKKQTGDEFVAGMWRRDLAAQILWTTRQDTYDDDQNRAPAEDCCTRWPSWSWASTADATFASHVHSKDLQLEVSNVAVEDEFAGMLTEDLQRPLSSLHLHGKLIPAHFSRVNLCRSRYRWAIHIVYPDTSFNPDNVRLDHPRLDLGDLSSRNRLYLMPAQVDNVTDQADQYLWARCLILELLDASQAKYRRVGMVSDFVDTAEGGRLLAAIGEVEGYDIPCLPNTSQEGHPHTILLV